MEPRKERELRLVALAGESGIAAFTTLCEGCGHRVAGCGPGALAGDAVSGAPPVALLVGAGRVADDSALPRGALFDLLVIHERDVLDSDAMLSRCRQVLVSPYDQDMVGYALEHLHAGDPVDPIALGMLELNIIGDSPQIKRVLRMVATVARYDAPVVVKGETGTGKELIARGIHYCSARRDEPFVSVNCCALGDNLLLAELFGYEQGAFTDARRAHAGLVAQARGGTLFLDEVDSLSPGAQGALLRFLQDREYRPLGSEAVQFSDVRVLSATNTDLEAAVAHGRFREDLYYRLHVVDIEMPPLRERATDIAMLTEHFLKLLSRKYQESEKPLHPITLEWMQRYPWPGNVRELENWLHRTFVLCDGPSICVPRVKGMPLSLAGPARDPHPPPASCMSTFQEEKARAIDAFERDYIHAIMRTAGGNVSLAARRAGKERRAFTRLLEKHGIVRERYVKS